MKSIMEEAASLTKAIENAWNKAGKPSEFKVRIFQESETNFFGFSKKVAKIAFFFEEDRRQEGRREDHRPQPQQQAPQQQDHQRRQPVAPPRQHHQAPTPARPVVVQPKPQPAPVKQESPRNHIVWSDDMIAAAKAWVTKTLELMELSHVTFQTEVIGNNLNIRFSSKLTDSDIKERQLFSSFAYLILTTLRHQFKTYLNRAKIILKS